MKFTALLSLALATLAIASPAAEPEVEKRSCQSTCASLAQRSCTSSCGGNNSCVIACYTPKYNACVSKNC